jgi:hypothetical protein
MMPTRARRCGHPSRLAAAAALLCLCLRTPQAADFSSNAVGTAGSEFLNIDVDPRGIAMGGAMTAAASDAYSMYWNPAGLSQVPRTSLGFMHNEYLAGIRLQYLSLAQRADENSVLAGAVRYMDAGAIPNTDINGNEMGTFRPRNYVYEMGWGRNIPEMADSERDVSLGIAGRIFHSDLVAHANGFAGDIGIQMHYAEAYIPHHFGLVVQNLGRGQKFDQVRDTLPFRAKIGSCILPKPFLLLSLEGVIPVSNQPYGAAGAELTVDASRDAKVFFRAGFNLQNRFNGPDGLRGLSLGTGLKMGDLSVDYAFTPFGMLGNVHQFAFNWNLPAKRSRKFSRR